MDNSTILEIVLLSAYGVIISAIIIGCIVFMSLIIKWVLLSKKSKLSKTPINSGVVGLNVGQTLLANESLEGVEIKKVGWFKGLIFGNFYSKSKKTIFLKEKCLNNSSILSVATIGKKVANAAMFKENNKLIKTNLVVEKIFFGLQMLFIPLLVVGAIIDVILYGNFSWFTMYIAAAEFVFYSLGFIVLLCFSCVHTKSSKKSKEMLLQSQIVDGNESNLVKKACKIETVNYFINYLLAPLFVIKFVFAFIGLLFKKKN